MLKAMRRDQERVGEPAAWWPLLLHLSPGNCMYNSLWESTALCDLLGGFLAFLCRFMSVHVAPPLEVLKELPRPQLFGF